VPRVALVLAAVAVTVICGVAPAMDPHVDPSFVPEGCPACHVGHGESGSPMLPAPQSELCLGCHGSQGKRDQAVMRGRAGAVPSPRLLSDTLAQPFVHPVDEHAFSRNEPGAVTCTSCHSAHRGMSVNKSAGEISAVAKRSPRNPMRTEFEMCLDCHARQGPPTGDPTDIGGLIDPRNPSFHPVKSPSKDGAPSVLTSMAGREINCTDCHGNAASGGARGPHGSPVKGILKVGYSATDGNAESEQAYGLCYSCHSRAAVLDSERFPQHRLHVTSVKASCSTCHNPHGSASLRALIRFDEKPARSMVAPTAMTGQLAFVSDSPGSGACYLSCHGYEHAPATYGGMAADLGLDLTEPARGFSSVPDGRLRPERTRGSRGRE